MENINCGIFIKLRLSDLCISDNDEVLFRYEYKYHCESLTVSLKHVFNDNLALNTYSNNKFGLFLEHFSVAILSSILPKKKLRIFQFKLVHFQKWFMSALLSWQHFPLRYKPCLKKFGPDWFSGIFYCLSGHHSWTLWPICLKFLLGNSGEPCIYS